jgi:hypothetical protein
MSEKLREGQQSFTQLNASFAALDPETLRGYLERGERARMARDAGDTSPFGVPPSRIAAKNIQDSVRAHVEREIKRAVEPTLHAAPAASSAPQCSRVSPTGQWDSSTDVSWSDLRPIGRAIYAERKGERVAEAMKAAELGAWLPSQSIGRKVLSDIVTAVPSMDDHKSNMFPQPLDFHKHRTVEYHALSAFSESRLAGALKGNTDDTRLLNNSLDAAWSSMNATVQHQSYPSSTFGEKKKEECVSNGFCLCDEEGRRIIALTAELERCMRELFPPKTDARNELANRHIVCAFIGSSVDGIASGEVKDMADKIDGWNPFPSDRAEAATCSPRIKLYHIGFQLMNPWRSSWLRMFVRSPAKMVVRDGRLMMEGAVYIETCRIPKPRRYFDIFKKFDWALNWHAAFCIVDFSSPRPIGSFVPDGIDVVPFEGGVLHSVWDPVVGCGSGRPQRSAWASYRRRRGQEAEADSEHSSGDRGSGESDDKPDSESDKPSTHRASDSDDWVDDMSEKGEVSDADNVAAPVPPPPAPAGGVPVRGTIEVLLPPYGKISFYHAGNRYEAVCGNPNHGRRCRKSAQNSVGSMGCGRPLGILMNFLMRGHNDAMCRDTHESTYHVHIDDCLDPTERATARAYLHSQPGSHRLFQQEHPVLDLGSDVELPEY